MDEEIQFYLDELAESMGKALAHVNVEMSRIRAGKASPAMLDGLRVDYYGTPTPVSQIANITAPDARSLLIKPWEKNMVVEVAKAIKNSDLGLNPVSDADGVRLNIPAMTEERRRDLVKQADHLFKLASRLVDSCVESQKENDDWSSRDANKVK